MTPFVPDSASTSQRVTEMVTSPEVPIVDVPDTIGQRTVEEEEDVVVEETSVEEFIAMRRTRRKIVPKPSWLKDHIAFALLVPEAEIPNHYNEAADSLDGDKVQNEDG